MLCIWWNQKDLVYYELLKPGDSITGDRYRLQLIRLSLMRKRPEYEQRHDKVILLHDNARPHVAKVVKKYLETLKWDVLPHSPYSPDIALSDYWLFRKVYDLANHRFISFENWLQNWIASKDKSFFRNGIQKLPERWEKIVSSDGQYFNWSVHSFCFEINAQKTDQTNLYSQYF